jgi:hypothetical protein
VATMTLRVDAAGKPRTEGFDQFPRTRSCPKGPATVTSSPSLFRHPLPLTGLYLVNVAPAGGATAAAPEGGALAGPSASPHLPVVGARNHVAVPGLAR